MKNINYTSSITWLSFQVINACLAQILLITALNATGTEIILIYLRSPYSHYLFIIIYSLFACSAVSCIMALGAIAKIKAKRPWKVAIAGKSITYALCCLLALALAYMKTTQKQRLSGYSPSAQDGFISEAGPFVQFGPFIDNHASTDTTMVIWSMTRVRHSERLRLKFGLLRDFHRMSETTESAGSDGYHHRFILANLKPDRIYYYTIAGNKKIYSFKTGPIASSSKSFRFLCMGDTGNTRKGGKAYSYHHEVLNAAYEFYRKKGIRPALKLHLGDLVKTGTDLKGWQNHLNKESEYGVSIPGMYVPGNHEFLADYGGNFYYFYEFPRYYSFDYGNAHFLCIQPFDGPGKSLDGPILSTGKEQYRFIRKHLQEQSGKKWIIVAIHIPILSTGDYNINEILVEQYLHLFREYKVDLVLSGHDHNFDSFHLDRNTDWGGTLYIVSGTGGSRIDSYIMDRKKKRWRTWHHDSSVPTGLYQDDRFTERYHRYGELSWGFTDVEISDNTLTVSYYRWLDYEHFLSITGQDHHSWKMIPLGSKGDSLGPVKLICRLEKKRTFYPR